MQRVPKRRVEALSGAGVPVEELTPAEARERFGFAYDDVESLVFTRDAGIALADATIDALADGARAAGAEILEHTRVESLDDVPGDRVVVTAGGWAPKLLGPGELDATPTRETTVYFRGERIPSLIDELGEQFYALTAPGVGVKAGWHKGGRPTDPDEDDVAPDERIVEAVSRVGRAAPAARRSRSRSGPRRASTRTSRTSASSASAAAATWSARRAAATASSSRRPSASMLAGIAVASVTGHDAESWTRDMSCSAISRPRRAGAGTRRTCPCRSSRPSPA